MTWSGQRQLTIIGGILGIIVIVLAIILYPKLNPTPTCTDGKQNGTEQGIDCGGACQKICSFATTDVVVKWSRAFQVTDTVASAVAYIENPNSKAAAHDVPYQFKLYDANHKFITSREGFAYIAPAGASAIFEGGIKVGNRIPVYATFHFTQDPVWVTIDPRVESIKLFPKDAVVENYDTKPRANAQIVNNSDLYDVNNVTVIAILYDKDDNAIGASQTLLEHLGQKESVPTYFTWQLPFPSEPVRTEVIARFNVFKVIFP